MKLKWVSQQWDTRKLIKIMSHIFLLRMEFKKIMQHPPPFKVSSKGLKKKNFLINKIKSLRNCSQLNRWSKFNLENFFMGWRLIIILSHTFRIIRSQHSSRRINIFNLQKINILNRLYKNSRGCFKSNHTFSLWPWIFWYLTTKANIVTFWNHPLSRQSLQFQVHG